MLTMLVVTKSVVYKQEAMWMGNLEGQKRIHTSVRFYDNEMHDEEKTKDTCYNFMSNLFLLQKKEEEMYGLSFNCIDNWQVL